MKLFSILLIAVFSLSISAKEVPLITITVDNDDYVRQLVLEVKEDTGDIIRLYKDKYKGRTRKSREAFEIKNVEKGFVIEERDGRKVVILKSANFSFHNGGDIDVDYLYDGRDDERKVWSELTLERTNDAKGWGVFTRKGTKVKRLRFHY